MSILLKRISNNVNCYFTQNRVTTIRVVRIYYVSKRTMILGSCSYGARAAYHLMKVLTTHSVLNDITKDNSKPLTDGLIDYTLDNTQGIMPHKSVLLKHTLAGNFKYSATQIYEQFSIKSQIPNISCAEGTTDSRIFPELPTLIQYISHYKKDIVAIHANVDSVNTPLGTIPGQQQTNHDWSTTIKTAWSNMNVSGYNTKRLLNDQKSGTGMLDHSTSGNLGIVYYDNQNKPISFTNKLVTLEELVLHDGKNFGMICKGLIHDNLYELSLGLKEKVDKILNNTQESYEKRHNEYQQYLWDTLQRHPHYNRNLSFIFIENVPLTEQEENFQSFANKFRFLLGSKLYDLNKRGDCREVTIAMLEAYKTTVDPQIINKIKQLHFEDKIIFNKRLIEDISTLLKKYVFYI